MAISIVTNNASLNAQRNLDNTTKALAANFSRLSSGMRINSAGDDAAGLAVSEKMKSQIRSMSQASRNANDGVSLLQTAEGAMNQNSGILIRMRELAMQSSNGTLGAAERDTINLEFKQLTNEVDRIANVTQFNGAKLLDGTNTSFSFQVGIGTTTNDTISATMVGMTAAAYGNGLVDSAGAAVASVDLTALSVTSAASATAALTTLDTAISTTSASRATLGAAQNRLQVTVANLQSAGENLTAANSRIRDVDVAAESATMTSNNILAQAGTAVLAQSNQLPSMALSLLRG
jgi:flagellin